MTEEQKKEWEEIESEIHTAFRYVWLEDGIGYYEAGALDDYLPSIDIKYQQAKAKDERDDWTKMLVSFKDTDIDTSRHCFMDAKGLCFYLPFLMIRREHMVNSILHFYISDVYKRPGYSNSRFTEAISLLTKEQKRCIYRFYTFLSKMENSEFSEYLLNSDFDTGEEAMSGFDYMEFIKREFA